MQTLLAKIIMQPNPQKVNTLRTHRYHLTIKNFQLLAYKLRRYEEFKSTTYKKAPRVVKSRGLSRGAGVPVRQPMLSWCDG